MLRRDVRAWQLQACRMARSRQSQTACAATGMGADIFSRNASNAASASAVETKLAATNDLLEFLLETH